MRGNPLFQACDLYPARRHAANISKSHSYTPLATRGKWRAVTPITRVCP